MPLMLGFAAAFAAAGAAHRAEAQALRQSLYPSYGIDSLEANRRSTVSIETQVDQDLDMPGDLADEAEAEAEGGTAADRALEGAELDGEADPLAPVAPLPLREAVDPYAPLGIRAGTFLFFPSLEIVGGRSSNPDASPTNPEASNYYALRPEFELRSDWSRHELTARASSDTEFDEDDTITSIDSELALRLDIVRDLVADLRATYRLKPEDLGDPELPASAIERPDAEAYGVSAGLSNQFGRIGLTGTLSYDAFRYEDARLSDGSIYDNSDRDYDETEARLRASYDMGNRLALFVEGGVNDRAYLRGIDDNGVRRGSNGYDMLAGVSIAREELLEGEIGIGYQSQRPEDDNLENVEGLFYRGSLAWRPTELTTVSLEGALRPEETTLGSTASGVRVASVAVKVEHALRRNLVVSASLAGERSDYVGLPLLEKNYTAALDLEYQVSRWLSWRAGVSQSRHESNAAGSDYDETRVEAGVTVRR